MSSKSALLACIEDHYRPGEPVTASADAAVKDAAERLETEVRPPDLIKAGHLVNGFWQLLFDSRDLLHASSDMARMSGGLLPEQSITITNTFQELRAPTSSAAGFYRNTMAMEKSGAAFLYISTASFVVKPEAPNTFEVSFSGTTFMPLIAAQGEAGMRAALGMPDHMPTSHTLEKPSGPFPSRVTYCDDTLRINRGADYIAVLRKL